MPPRNCAFCDKARAIIRRPKTGDHVCKECFFWVFETEVHNTIISAKLFRAGEKIAIGASGGKGRNMNQFKYSFRLKFNLDSTVLAHVMKTLNERYNYGLELFLLSIDEGITGYRDDSLEVGAPMPVYCLALYVSQTVKRNQQQYNLPLKILSYDELYGWTMDAVVSQVGRKNNCERGFPFLPSSTEQCL